MHRHAYIYIHTYMRTYICTYIHTYTHTYIPIRPFIQSIKVVSFEHLQVPDWQPVSLESALRISRTITQTANLLYEKGDTNLETSHREWGPWVNTQPPRKGKALGPRCFSTDPGPLSKTLWHIIESLVPLYQTTYLFVKWGVYNNCLLWTHKLMENICNNTGKCTNVLVSGS